MVFEIYKSTLTQTNTALIVVTGFHNCVEKYTIFIFLPGIQYSAFYCFKRYNTLYKFIVINSIRLVINIVLNIKQ